MPTYETKPLADAVRPEAHDFYKTNEYTAKRGDYGDSTKDKMKDEKRGEKKGKK